MYYGMAGCERLNAPITPTPDHVMDWLLLFPYIALQWWICFLILCMGAAGHRIFLKHPFPYATPLMNFCGSFVMGLAAWSLTLTTAGLFGGLNRPCIAALTATALAAGGWAIRGHRDMLAAFAPAQIWRRLRDSAQSPASRTQRVARWALVAYAAFLVFWMTIGSALPDMCQDSMWYHLSIPRAWTHRGVIAAFPLNMPSNYPLGLEIIYAGLLTFFDEISCSMLYSLIQMMCLTSMIALAGALVGETGAWAGAALAILFWGTAINIPIPAVNDASALLTVCWGLCLLCAPRQLLAVRCSWERTTIVTGFFLGAAAAFKLIAAGFSLPFAALVSFWTAASRSEKGAWKTPFLGLGSWTIAMAPWMGRNLLLGCGNPFFPFMQKMIPSQEAYADIVNALARLNFVYYPLSTDSFHTAISQLTHKLHIFMTAPDMFFLFFVFATLVGLGAGRGWARKLAAAQLLQIAALTWLGGENEIIRYFSICYATAVPLGAWLFVRLIETHPHVKRMASLGFLLPLVLACALHWRLQLRHLNYATIQWPGRPVLTETSRNEYSRNKECGGALHVTLKAAARSLPASARAAVLPDCVYPFHFDHTYLWNDEVSPPFAQTHWRGLDADGVLQWLRDNDASHVIFVRKKIDPRIEQLTGEDKLAFRAFAPDGDWPKVKIFSRTGIEDEAAVTDAPQ